MSEKESLLVIIEDKNKRLSSARGLVSKMKKLLDRCYCSALDCEACSPNTDKKTCVDYIGRSTVEQAEQWLKEVRE